MSMRWVPMRKHFMVFVIGYAALIGISLPEMMPVLVNHRVELKTIPMR